MVLVIAISYSSLENWRNPLASNCLCGSYPSPVPSVQNRLPSNGKLPLNTIGSKESGQQIRKYFWLAALTHNPFLSQLPTIQCKSMWISSPQISIGRTRLPSFSSYSGVSHVHKVSPFFLSINLLSFLQSEIIAECFTTELAVSNSAPSLQYLLNSYLLVE